MRLLTAPGLSGVAVVLFGDGERDALAACLRTPTGRPFTNAAGRPFENAAGRPRLATLALDGEVVDEVLVVDRAERGVELHLHGSPAVIAALRAAFGTGGATAEEVSPAERLLRSALSVEQLDLALEQLALERQDRGFPALLRELDGLGGAAAERQLAAAIERSRVALAHVEPCRLVLAGAQNAGKSTLFNRLLFRERALTGSLPGLTRDPVRELTTLWGYPFELADTAGEGAAASAVDEGAIARGRRLRAGAVLLLVVDGSCGPEPPDRALLAQAGRALVVANKRDLPPAGWPDDLRCDLRLSATADPPPELRRRIGQQLATLRSLPPAGPIGGPAALDRRQLAALQRRSAT